MNDLMDDNLDYLIDSTLMVISELKEAHGDLGTDLFPEGLSLAQKYLTQAVKKLREF